jgi:hypothetical protein
MFFNEPDVAYQIHQSCLASRIALEGEGYYLSGVSLHKVGCLAYDKGDFATALDRLDRACECFRKSSSAEQGLLPRYLLKLGHVKVKYAHVSTHLLDEERATQMAAGQRLINEGMDLARQFMGPDFVYHDNDDSDSLVRPTYW